MDKKKVLISACLTGVNCRYAGDGKKIPELERLMEEFDLIPVCPEQLGGLPTPRDPSERRNGRVVSINGKDVTDNFVRGAEETLRIAELFHADTAVLKERSPSCGYGVIYDGSFSGKFREGNGITAELLAENGIRIYGESIVDSLFNETKGS